MPHHSRSRSVAMSPGALGRLAVHVGRRTVGTALREWPRSRKARWQKRNPAPGDTRLAFVTGTQRSGTTMLLEVLDRSPHTLVYHEYHPEAMDDFRLRPTTVIEELAQRAFASVMVTKPLTEAHVVDRLLRRFPDARVIWMFRRYQDVANSAIVKWPGTNTQFIDAIRDGRLAQLDWRGERVNEAVIEAIRKLTAHQLGEQEGAALFWYARNQLYFDLELESDPRVLLVQYEDLVTDRRRFEAVFAHLGIPFEPRFLEGVNDASLRRRPFGPIHPEVERLCDEMMSRLEEAKARQASVAEDPSPARIPVEAARRP